MTQNILVAGATGRTGRFIIQKLIQQGYATHALVRDLADAKKLLLGSDLTFHQGDVRNLESVMGAMSGIDAVTSVIGARTPVGKNCPKNVDYQGVVNLVHAAVEHNVHRFILVSSIAVTHPEHPLNCFGKVLDWKRKAEKVLQVSPLEYAIIRPGGLIDIPGEQRTLIFDQGDHLMGTISRDSVAETCLQALRLSSPLQITFEVIEKDHKGQPNWEQLFQSLSRDGVQQS